jgi:hypothetical protein
MKERRKCKGNNVPVQAIMVYVYEVNGQLHALVSIPPGKSSCRPLITRLSGLQSLEGIFGKEKKILLLLGVEAGFLGLPVLSLVTTPTELSRHTQFKK